MIVSFRNTATKNIFNGERIPKKHGKPALEIYGTWCDGNWI